MNKINDVGSNTSNVSNKKNAILCKEYEHHINSHSLLILYEVQTNL